jgi:hypothetical protein
MGDDTHPVRVSGRTWQDLNARKRPGETFEDVVSRLLEETTEDKITNGQN